MRDLLFRNLTSQDKTRKMISTSEVVDRQGVRSVIRRHFVCMVKEVPVDTTQKPMPYLYVLKEHNAKAQIEKFFCRVKGSIFAISKGKLFLIFFVHSLRIHLSSNYGNIIKFEE